MLIAKPIKHPLGRVPLLVAGPAILLQPAVDDLGEPVQLRPLHRGGAPVSRRRRERQHLPDAVARDVEMTRRLALAHALRASQTNLSVHVHGDDPPALPPTAERAKVDDF